MPRKIKLTLRRALATPITQFAASTPQSFIHGKYFSKRFDVTRGDLRQTDRHITVALPQMRFSDYGIGAFSVATTGEISPTLATSNVNLKTNRRSMRGQTRDVVRRNLDEGGQLQIWETQPPRLVIEGYRGSVGDFRSSLRSLAKKFPLAETVKLKKREFSMDKFRK